MGIIYHWGTEWKCGHYICGRRDYNKWLYSDDANTKHITKLGIVNTMDLDKLKEHDIKSTKMNEI